ncbi:MAG: hypothetical protein V1690_03975 [Candidatus Moraniibacteriota bacterium]
MTDRKIAEKIEEARLAGAILAFYPKLHGKMGEKRLIKKLDIERLAKLVVHYGTSEDAVIEALLNRVDDIIQSSEEGRQYKRSSLGRELFCMIETAFDQLRYDDLDVAVAMIRCTILETAAREIKRARSIENLSCRRRKAEDELEKLGCSI